MSRPEPKEDSDFPVYKVRAACACGRKGWTKALQEYPKGTVITTPCSDCVKAWEARVESHTLPPLQLVKPEPKPLERKDHWTDKIP